MTCDYTETDAYAYVDPWEQLMGVYDPEPQVTFSFDETSSLLIYRQKHPWMRNWMFRRMLSSDLWLEGDQQISLTCCNVVAPSSSTDVEYDVMYVSYDGVIKGYKEVTTSPTMNPTTIRSFSFQNYPTDSDAYGVNFVIWMSLPR